MHTASDLATDRTSIMLYQYDLYTCTISNDWYSINCTAGPHGDRCMNSAIDPAHDRLAVKHDALRARNIPPP
jgi:hypothetical protein